MCDCGSQETMRGDYMVCLHCDGGCVLKDCGQCRKYTNAVSRRLTRS